VNTITTIDQYIKAHELVFIALEKEKNNSEFLRLRLRDTEIALYVRECEKASLIMEIQKLKHANDLLQKKLCVKNNLLQKKAQ
jgi:hypothetical protein